MAATILEHLELSFNNTLTCQEAAALPPYRVEKHLIAHLLLDGSGHLYAQWTLEASR
jgi:hypothetical protein